MTQESWQPSKSMEMQSVFHMCWSWGEVVACFKEATRGRQEPCLPNLGSAQLLRPIRFLATPWTAAHQASLSITDSWSLLRLVSIELVMPPNRLILCHPLLPPPSVFPSIGVFSSGSVLRIRWPEYWNFNISPYNEYSGLIAFRMDWLDLLAVQETLKSLLQHHSSRASILWHSAAFMVQLSHAHMTTGTTVYKRDNQQGPTV